MHSAWLIVRFFSFLPKQKEIGTGTGDTRNRGSGGAGVGRWCWAQGEQYRHQAQGPGELVYIATIGRRHHEQGERGEQHREQAKHNRTGGLGAIR